MALNRPMNTWHCVRCHCTYTRADNANADPASMTCTIQHTWGSATLLPSSTNFANADRQYIREAVCCPGIYRTEIRAAAGIKYLPAPPCFRGKHTTNPKQVDYNHKSVKMCGDAHH